MTTDINASQHAGIQGRYARQMSLRQVGKSGQEELSQARVAIVGVGALGSLTADWLVRAGIGYVRLVDRDVVEHTNLSRQILYDEDDANQALPKAFTAAGRLAEINPDVEVEAIADDLVSSNALRILSGVDVIVDGTDNYQTRRLLNDASVKLGIPWAYAGAVSTYGTTAFFQPGKTPCFACLYPEPDPIGYDTCDTVGVFGPAIGVIASTQAASVLRYLLGGKPTVEGVTSIDAWSGESYTVGFGERRPDCPCCVARTFHALDAVTDSVVVTMCGRDTVQVRPSTAATVEPDLLAFAGKLHPHGNVQVTAHLLRFIPHEAGPGFFLFGNGRALISGVESVAEARAVYARYIGM